jgi:hypothetical protein
LFIYADSSGKLSFVFVDYDGNAATPSNVDINIIDPTGAVAKTLTLTDLLPADSPGHYHYDYDTGTDAVAGVWRVECKATIQTFEDFQKTTFNVMVPSTIWISGEEARRYALVRYDSLNYSKTSVPFSNEYEFNVFVEEFLIPSAQGHVNAYCNRDFDTDYSGAIPAAIRDICARVVSNMIQYLVMNKSGPLIRMSDYQISMPKQDVLTTEIKMLLDPWITYGLAAQGFILKHRDYVTQKTQEQWD